MAESIFTSQVPGNNNATDPTSATLGTLFTAAVNGTIDGGRWLFPTTLPSGTVKWLLYQWNSDASGTLLASADFVAPVAGAYNTVSVPSVNITAGQRYVTAIFTPDRYVFTNNFFNGNSVTNGNLTAPADDAGTPARNGKFIQSAQAYPINSFQSTCYFVDVLFTASAPPTGQTIAVDRSLELDVARLISPLAGAVTGNVGRALETDVAFPISALAGAVTGAVGRASETDVAFGVTPVLGVTTVPIGKAQELDTARSIIAQFTQLVAIGRADEIDTAQPIAVRVSGAKTPFSTGPCEPWEPIWCGQLSPAAQAVSGDAVQIATDVLWQASGQRFGLCQVTLRPCREECSNGYESFDDWWPGVGGRLPYAPRGGPRPWWSNGVWYNVCGTCVGSCSCTVIDEAFLPAPVREVIEVRMDGIVMDPSLYRVDENRKLVRLDGQLWPMCQDMAADDSQPNTWSVTITVGEDVPALGRRAVGELAQEIMLECLGADCHVPYDVTSLSRQGVTLNFGQAGEVDTPLDQLGLRMVNLFIATFNPSGLAHRAKTYDVNRNPRPWRRTNTS